MEILIPISNLYCEDHQSFESTIKNDSISQVSNIQSKSN